ncbi:MAG: alpha/beta hydrolase [Deltaproteobacteria bacterium]|nr:alpha/beta hydrolase [Deltaproteobacteria bacterium]
MNRPLPWGSLACALALATACTPESSDLQRDPQPETEQPSADGDLVAADAPALAGCPAGSPSCPGPYEVDHALQTYTVSDLATGLCHDLPQAMALAYADGNAGELRLDAFFPQLNQQWPPTKVPLVIFSPGASQHYNAYDSLLEHLASQGFAAMSVDVFQLGSSVRRRSEYTRCALRHIANDAILSAHIDLEQIVVMGHSRGGEAAVMTANRLAESTNALEASMDVDAVVGLAPASQCHNKVSSCGFNDVDGNPLPITDQQDIIASTSLRDDAAEAFLVLQGSRDDDVDGQSLTLFELASTEYPADQPWANPFDPNVEVMRKAMVWAFDVPHHQFGGTGGFGGGPMGNGALLSRAYVGAFLRWNVLGDNDMMTYFDDNRSRPFCVTFPQACGEALDPLTVFNEYVEGNHDGARRLVIHDIQVQWDPRVPGVTSPAQGGGVDAVASVGPRIPSKLTLAWEATAESVQMRFDEPLDGSRFDLLSLRVGVVPDANDCVTPSPAFDLTIGLESEHQGPIIGHEVQASDYVNLRHPDCGLAPGDLQPHAQTVRVPLADFEGVDLEILRTVRLTVDPTTSGPPAQLFIDSIELVNNAEYCGNGEIEGLESCDGDDLGGLTCKDFGFEGGQLHCNDDCRFVEGACNMCGNGVTDPGEACEPGMFPAGMDCKDFGFDMGDLSCDAECTVIGTSTCHGGIAINAPGSYADCLNPQQRADCDLLGPAGCAATYGHLDCVGGPCRPTDPSDRDLGSLLDWFNEDGGEFHPDGTYRDAKGDLYYCNDVGGEQRVCADEDGWGVCRRCSANGGPNDTRLGCSCTEGDDCLAFGNDPAMSCYGADFGPNVGTCWSVNDGPPSWQCPESVCGHAPYWGEDEMYCEHYAAQAECQPMFACSGPEAIICADDGPDLLCDPNGGGCVAQCQADAHCDQALGWPADHCCVNAQCQYVQGGCP